MPSLLARAKSFPDRITFDSPLFVKKIRILMKGPVNYYFGIYRVDFFVKNWTMVIKNTTDGQCNEDCWIVNTVTPGEGSKVKTSSCVGSIGYSENRELFTLLYDSRLIHFNSGLCLVSASNYRVTLQNCNNAQWANDGRHKFNFMPDGTISTNYAADECIYKPLDSTSETIESTAIAESTSEMADGAHNASRSIDGNEVSYWASNPGDSICTITLFFKSWMSMNDVTLNWKYRAEEFSIFAYTMENGWKEILKVTKNEVNKNTIMLGRINARAIQIKMNKGSEKYLGKIIYGLISISISDGAIALERKKCSSIANNSREWQLDDQFYYYVGNKGPYMVAYNELTKTYLKLKKLNRLINMEFKPVEKAKTKAKQINHLLEQTNKQLSNLLNKIKKFKTEKYAMKDLNFDNVIERFKLDYFYPYFPKLKNGESGGESSGPPQIGSVFTSPGKDCWHIKQLIPFKKSGYYWIKPRCAKKSLRVFCDFSVDDLGTSIYLWKSTSTPINTAIVDVSIASVTDIQKLCALEGLYPIEIRNKNVVKRITQYLETIGYDLGAPLVYPLGYDWGCDAGKCSRTYRSLSTKLSDVITSYFPIPEHQTMTYNKIQKFPFMGLGWNDTAKPAFFNLNNPQTKIGGLICSTNEHNPPLADPTESSLQCSDILSGNAKIDGSVGTKVKILCPAFCAEKSEHKIYGKETYSDNSSICRAAIHAGLIADADGGSVMLVIGPSYEKYVRSTQNGIASHKLELATNKSYTFELVEDKCPIDFFKIDEEEAAVEAEDKSSEDPNKVEKTSIPSPPTKDIPFDSTATVKSTSYAQPQPYTFPVLPEKENRSNMKLMEVYSDITNGAVHQDQQKPSQNEMTKIMQKLDPITNPLKIEAEKQKLADKKEACVVTTDISIKEIEDFRRKDYVNFKNLEEFGGKMDKLIKEFKSEYAYGVWPSKLSNKHFKSKIIIIYLRYLCKIREDCSIPRCLLRKSQSQRRRKNKKY